MCKKRLYTTVDWADWSLLRVFVVWSKVFNLRIFGLQIGPVCFEFAWGKELEVQYGIEITD